MWVPNAVAFEIAGFSIYWYGILITAGVLAGILVSMRRAKRYGIDSDTVIDYALFIIPAAIIGARLYFVAFNLKQFSQDWLSVFDVRQGGLAVYGGIIGAVIAAFGVSKYKKLSLLTMCDVAFPAVALGQAIGRWGNFTNQEAFGELVTNPSLQFFPYAVYIEYSASWHMAAFFYESISCLLIFLFLSWFTKYAKRKGDILLLYCILYGIERAIVEGFRLDSLYWGEIRVSQALSVLLAVIGCAVFIARFFKAKADVVEIDPSLAMRRRTVYDDEETAAAKDIREESLTEARAGDQEKDMEENEEKEAEEASIEDESANDASGMDDAESEKGKQ